MFKFPYTNLHELNLDWILEKVKTLVDNNDEFNEKADYAVETADEAKTIAEQAAQATIADGAVTTPKLADNAVTTAKIADNAVTLDKLAEGTIIRNNIFENWYFAGNGFPINQRGLNNYASGYGIDRWYSTGNVTVGSDGLILDDDVVLLQKVENLNNLLGKEITLSFLTDSGLISGTVVFDGTTANYAVSADFAIGFNSSLNGFYIYSQNANSVKIKGAKLEVGATQSLVRYLNNTPVFNEIPDIAVELERCQRYYIKNVGSYSSGYIASDGIAYIFVPTPVTMRNAPSVTVVTLGDIVTSAGVSSITAINIFSIKEDGVLISCTTATTGVFSPCCTTGTTVNLSAEI